MKSRFLPIGTGSARTLARQKERLGLTNKIVKYSVNEKFFEEWSSGLAWVLGLIWTDGHLQGNKVCITSIDKDMLDIVNELTSNERPIKKRSSGNGYDFAITNKNVAGRLKNIGLLPGSEGKTEKAQFLYCIPDEYKKDFVRGLIDGDGSVHIRQKACDRGRVKYPTLLIYLCGISFIKDGLEEWLYSQGIKSKTYLEESGVWKVCIFQIESLKILYNLLYQGEPLYCLQRKYDKFKKWIEGRQEYEATLVNDNPQCFHCNGKTYYTATRANGTKKYICSICRKSTKVLSENFIKEKDKRPLCLHCGHKGVTKAGIKNQGQTYRCNSCNRRFTVGTVAQSRNTANDSYNAV